MQWVLCGDAGKNHRVGIYHGEETGHVLIYCNDEIVTIDFSVKKDKTYTFFIDDELCNLSLEKGNDGFAYGFTIDEKAPTPRNLARKRQDSKDAQNLILWMVGFFVFIALIVILFYTIG